MSTPLFVPEELKPISSFVARANELTVAEPVIAYWCLYYAVQLSMTLGPKEKESNEFLFGLMDKLEIMKGELITTPAVIDDGVAATYVESFAIKIFGQADKEDRSGRATRLTAKKFLASANFLDLLSIFGDLGADAREKIKYSKWKASDIGKAFREGRKPVPGPAGGLPIDEEVEATIVTSEEEEGLILELAALGTPDERGEATARDTPTQSAQSISIDRDELFLPATPNSFPPAVPTPPAEDERPVTPAFPTFLNTPTPSSTDIPTAFESDLDSASPSPPIVRVAPPSHQTADLFPPSPVNIAAAFPAAVFPSAPTVPLTQSYFPPSPAPLASPVVVPVARSPASIPTPIASDAILPKTLDPATIGLIQKHAKWAISALNYDDLDTARKELRAALVMLDG